MADSEKITINLSAVDLGRIDLLAEEGFYSNRADFIRAAIRKELDSHRDVVEKSVARRSSTLGMVVYTRSFLEACLKKKQKLDVVVVGAVHFAGDVTPDLAKRTIQTLEIHGVLRASQEIKDALADRMR
jgi:Arc/MetJ-type ribon-helix-helix transcriptional regulator